MKIILVFILLTLVSTCLAGFFSESKAKTPGRNRLAERSFNGVGYGSIVGRILFTPGDCVPLTR